MATSNVIKEVNQFEVVTILANDNKFCRNWKLFCRILIFPPSIMYDLEKMDRLNSPISNIIFKIMDYWKSLCPAKANLIHLSQILRQIGCVESAEHIDALFENPSFVKILSARFHNLQIASSSKPFHPTSKSLEDQLIWFNIKSPTTYYSGRENEMQSIENEWKSCQRSKKMFVAITGLGGIGKSELARNFAIQFHQSYSGHCIWIDAETSQDLLQSFVNLADELNISLKDELGKDKNLEVLAVEIYKTLFGKTCLLIFDNLESYDQPILKSLSDLASRQPPSVLIPFVLTTSRFRPADKFFGSKCTHIELDNLSPDDAIQFFSRYLLVDQNSIDDSILNSIKKLCERLQCYPLAMQQAAAYINESTLHGLRRNNLNINYKIEEYLANIDFESKRLLNYSLPESDKLGTATTYLTWRFTFDKIADMGVFGRGAIKLMHIISFLSPDNISSELLYKILSTIENDSNICQENGSLEILRDHSIIYANNDLQTISIHRLVQEVTRLKLSEDGKFNEFLDRLLAGVVEMLINKNIIIPSHQLIHAQTIWDRASGNKELVEKYGNFPHWICNRLYGAGKYHEMYDFSCRSLNVLEAAIGERSRCTLNVQYCKGWALYDLGEYSKSLEIHTDVYVRQKELFGEDDESTLLTANKIGSVHRELNNHEEALKWFTNTLQKREKIMGREDGLALNLKHNLALVYNDEGKYGQALDICQDVLQVEERVWGDKHSNSLITKLNLASVRYQMKDFVGALQIFQEVLEVQEVQQVLKADHPNTLTTKAWIAQSLESLGRMDEAFQLWKEVHEKREKVLGPSHPHTIYAKNAVEMLKNSQ